MHLQHLTLTAVSDVTYITSKRGRFTQFGFVSTQEKFIEARTFGHLHPKVGDKLTMVMPAPDHWRDVYGWYDHLTKTVHLPFFRSQLILFALLSIFCLPMFILCVAAIWQGVFLLLLGLLLVVVCWYAAYQNFYRAYRARHLLLNYVRSLKAPGSCA